jgi:hypothetical protein
MKGQTGKIARIRQLAFFSSLLELRRPLDDLHIFPAAFFGIDFRQEPLHLLWIVNLTT